MFGLRHERVIRSGVVVGTLTASLMTIQGTSVDSASSAMLGAPSAVRAEAGKVVPRGPFAVILVIDAARPDEIDLTRMPYLARLVAVAATYSRAWVGQLPSITETSHATIGTGVCPNRHLVLGDTWRIPGTEQMAPDLLNGQLTRTGYIGKFIHQKAVPTIASIVHQRYTGSLVVALSGHKIYAADGLGAGADPTVGHDAGEESRDGQAGREGGGEAVAAGRSGEVRDTSCGGVATAFRWAMTPAAAARSGMR